MKKGVVKNNERIILLDAHAILHRAFHAMPDFQTSKGMPTGALYGLVLMVIKMIGELAPDYIVACFDLPKPTYRHEVYEGYKAGRPKVDPNLVTQLEAAPEMCSVLGIPVYSHPGFEADDMLGTICEQLKKTKLDVIIASGDMDTMQLVDDDKVRVYTLKKGINDTILYNQKAVMDRFGFLPKLLVDYKGLRGDPSDNIIGVPGIGEKTATDLIKNFGTIENIYKYVRKDQAKLEAVGVKPRIIKILEDNEEEALFSKALATIRRDAPIHFAIPEKRWCDGVDVELVKGRFRELEFRSLPAKLDVALSSLGREGASLVQTGALVSPEEMELFRETQVAISVLNSNFVNSSPTEILDFSGKGSLQDAHTYILAELHQQKDRVFAEIEKPIIPLLNEMTRWGIKIDRDVFTELAKRYKHDLTVIEKDIFKLAGEEFNVASPKQLGTILFDKLGLVVKNQKKTSTGSKSTKESELDKMRDLHPIIPLILEFRELSKILGTYVDPIPRMIAEDGRLHTEMVQIGAATGRMASINPNLQNIPIRSPKGRLIRDAFVASAGHAFLSLDYSQIELRIAAILSRDSRLIEIFKNGEDIHEAVARDMFGLQDGEVDKEKRRHAKVINFGILYGMGVNALMAGLAVDRKTAVEFINTYFYKYGGLFDYLEKVKHEARRAGYTETLFGRRRYFEGLNSKIPFIKAAAERMAINAPMQGTSADIVKIAIARVDELLKGENLESRVHLVLQIHDELIYEVDESVLDDVRRKITGVMEGVLTKEQSVGVPLLVNSSVGKDWGHLN